MINLVREPLLHFVLAGVLVFFVYPELSGGDDKERVIRVSAGEIERLVSTHEMETGNASLSDAEIEQLVRRYTQRLALAHEARILGLDDGDIIIERRLAQKMQFMISDMSVLPDTDDQQLRAWMQKNEEKFQRPATVSFEHIFFKEIDNNSLSGLLTRLNRSDETDWYSFGDAFMLKRQYGDVSQREVTRIFGSDFSEALFNNQTLHAWIGPVHSAFGSHLLRIREITPARLPKFEDVSDLVRADWLEMIRRQNNDKAVDAIVSQYQIEIEN